MFAKGFREEEGAPVGEAADHTIAGEDGRAGAAGDARNSSASESTADGIHGKVVE